MTQPGTDLAPFDLQLDLLPSLPLPVATTHQDDELLQRLRLLRVDELTRDDDTPLSCIVERALASLASPEQQLVYLLDAQPGHIGLYFGVLADSPHAAQTSQKILQQALEGHLPGIRLQRLNREAVDDGPLQRLQRSRRFGRLCGVPSQDDEQDPAAHMQSIDRVIDGLLGHSWRLLIVAEPGTADELHAVLDNLHQLADQLHPWARQNIQASHNSGESDSIGHNSSHAHGESDTHSDNRNHTHTTGSNTGSSDSRSCGKTYDSGKTNTGESTQKSQGTTTSDALSTGSANSHSDSETITHTASQTHNTQSGQSSQFSLERINTRLQQWLKHLQETQIPRFDEGMHRGMFRTAMYLFADDRETLQLAGQQLRAIFQGRQTHRMPLRFEELDRPLRLSDCLNGTPGQSQASSPAALVQSMASRHGQLLPSTWLTLRELALISGLPEREVPGLGLRQTVTFGVNVPSVATASSTPLGHILHHGRLQQHNPVHLSPDVLNRHVFITGVTGAGKTTTCQKLLLESGLPFLVIEPAKTEYRELLADLPSGVLFTPGHDEFAPFRFNPFELLPGERLAGHVDTLKAAFIASFAMEAAMPQLIEQAIVRCYTDSGWDIDDIGPARTTADRPWPVFADFLNALDAVIREQGMGRELEEKYRGSLHARLRGLVSGAKGAMLNTRCSVDFNDLLQRPVVIELEELRDETDKSLLMALIVGRLAEAVKLRHRQDPGFRHLTLIEEAHRLLARQTHADSPRAHGVAMFANLLAEVRKYGEGLIIADQIPNALTPEVIKNTNTKIVHRLFARDDREAIGDSIGLDDHQKGFLPHLREGEAIVWSAGWHKPVWLGIARHTASATTLSQQRWQQQGDDYAWQHRQRLWPWFDGDQHAQLHALRQRGRRLLKRLIQQAEVWTGKPSVGQRLNDLRRDLRTLDAPHAALAAWLLYSTSPRQLELDLHPRLHAALTAGLDALADSDAAVQAWQQRCDDDVCVRAFLCDVLPGLVLL